jgi:mRNA-degrading endonuclease toxin of MazEF toxin-antitoxin module
MPNPSPRRGEIWFANLGDPKRHAVVIISLDNRNLSQRTTSVLAVPFGSYGFEGPTSRRMEPGETGLPEPSFLKAHFIQVVDKGNLIERLPRKLSSTQLREVVLMVIRAIDPDAPWPGR